MDVIVHLMMRPPILQLAYYIVGPFYSNISVSFLSWVKHLEGFYLLPNTNHSGTLVPSFHRMRENPYLGQYTLKSKEIRKWRGTMMESGKYGREWYDGSLREFSVGNPSPRKTTY